MTVASFTYEPNPAGLDRLLGSETGPYGQWLTRVGNRAVNEAKLRANVDTGLMRSRIEFSLTTEDGRLVGLLAARTNYAVYVHQGTAYYPGNPFLSDAVRVALGG